MCHHFIKRVILGESAKTEEERQGREGKGWKGARVRLRQSPAEGSSLLTLQVGSGVQGPLGLVSTRARGCCWKMPWVLEGI